LAGTNEIRFQSQIDPRKLGYLQDHRVYGIPSFPNSCYFEIAWAAAEVVFGKATPVLEDVSIEARLFFADQSPFTLQSILSPISEDCFRFQVFSTLDDPGNEAATWRGHITGVLRKAGQTNGKKKLVLCQERRHSLDVEAHFAHAQHFGVDYGPAFRNIAVLSGGDNQVLGTIALATFLQGESVYQWHPVLLEDCFVVAGYLKQESSCRAIRFPVACKRFTFFRKPTTNLLAHAVIRVDPSEQVHPLVADLAVFDDKGGQIALVEGLKLELLPESNATRPRRFEFLRRLQTASDEQQEALMLSYLHEIAAVVLGVQEHSLDASRSLNRLGLDSLMALTLRNRIKNDLGIDLSVVDFLEGASVADLVLALCDHIRLRPAESGDGALAPVMSHEDDLSGGASRMTMVEGHI
jgi:acyl carrier protein